jgi:hypothetical protein
MRAKEHIEGPEAAKRFEVMITALFRAPKPVALKKIRKKAARKRRITSEG